MPNFKHDSSNAAYRNASAMIKAADYEILSAYADRAGCSISSIIKRGIVLSLQQPDTSNKTEDPTALLVADVLAASAAIDAAYKAWTPVRKLALQSADNNALMAVYLEALRRKEAAEAALAEHVKNNAE